MRITRPQGPSRPTLPVEIRVPEEPRAERPTDSAPTRAAKSPGAARAVLAGRQRPVERALHREDPAITPPRIDARPRKQGPAFLRFRADVKRAAGPDAWHAMRSVARSKFGSEVFSGGRLALDRKQLGHIAKDPADLERRLHALKQDGTLPESTSGHALAKTFARSARDALARRSTFTVATVNDDFTDRKTNLKRVKADVILAQETKNTDVKRALKNRDVGVHQDTAHDDKQGTSVIWNKKRMGAGKRGYALGTRPQGRKMLSRWLNFTDVNIDGQKVRMVSAHRPPARFKALWPTFDKRLADFVKGHKGPIIVGMDSNQHTHEGLEKMTGLKWQGPPGSIDGFLVSKGIRVSDMRRLPRGSSDHQPVKAKFSIRR